MIFSVYRDIGVYSTVYSMQYFITLFLTSILLFITVMNTQMKIHLIDLDTLDSKWRGIRLSHPKNKRIDLVIELLHQ